MRLVRLEQEELELRPQVVVVEAHVLRPGERPAHLEARVALVGLAPRLQHVAEQPADLVGLAGPPGQDPERGRVGHGDHVRLLDPVEPGDRRAVEAHARPRARRPAPRGRPRTTSAAPKMSVNQNRMNSTLCSSTRASTSLAPVRPSQVRSPLTLTSSPSWACSTGLALLAGADAHRVLDRQDEQLPVADRAGAGVPQDHLLDQADVLRLDDALELELRPQVDGELRAAVVLGDRLLPARALDLA